MPKKRESNDQYSKIIEIFDQIEEAIAKGEGKLDSQIEGRLEDLNDVVELFTKDFEQFTRSRGIEETEFKRMMESSSRLSREDLNAFKRIENLKNAMKHRSRMLKLAFIINRSRRGKQQGDGPASSSKDFVDKDKKKKKLAGRKRKNKFKRLGGDGGWMPT